MNAPQFTPGPWATNIARLSDGSISVAHVVSAGRAAVAQLANYDEWQTEANASLIAAAPELYEALEHVWQHMLLDQDAGPLVARALAKARGEQ